MLKRSPSEKAARSAAAVRILAAAGAGAAAIALSALPASAQETAPAAPGPVHDCSFSGTLCLYEGPQFTGERFHVRALDPEQGACVDLVAHGWGGRAQSAANTNARSAAMFQNDDCTGHPVEIPNGASPALAFAPSSVFVY